VSLSVNKQLERRRPTRTDLDDKVPQLAHGDAGVASLVLVLVVVSVLVVLIFLVVLLVAAVVLHLLKDLGKLVPGREEADPLALVAHPRLEDEPPPAAVGFGPVHVERHVVQLILPELVQLVGKLDVDHPAARDGRSEGRLGQRRVDGPPGRVLGEELLDDGVQLVLADERLAVDVARGEQARLGPVRPGLDELVRENIIVGPAEESVRRRLALGVERGHEREVGQVRRQRELQERLGVGRRERARLPGEGRQRSTCSPWPSSTATHTKAVRILCSAWGESKEREG
jgi:hypothetical protein